MPRLVWWAQTSRQGKGIIIFSEDVTKTLMFRCDWLAKHDVKPEDVSAFPVRGHSMVDMPIVDGSVVLANRKKNGYENENR